VTKWSGRWVGYKYDPSEDVGVFAFQNTLRLEEIPLSFPVRISADNRYKLYVNGKMVAFGPQRGDERHWFYDHFNLAPYLEAGDNLIVALVWNFGWMAPMAQHSVRTAFLFDSEAESLNTPGGWKVSKVDGWKFAMMHSTIGDFYIDIGPGEIIEPVLGGVTQRLADGLEPNVISHAEDRGAGGGGTPWMMIPRTLPPMRYASRARQPIVRRGFAGDPGCAAEGQLSAPLQLNVGSKLLLDYGELLCAYPRVVLSGPAGSLVKLTYAEAMWNPDGSKGNRDEVAGKEMRGYQDKLILGSEPAVYEPLWWRTYRYLMIEADSSTPQPTSSSRSDRDEEGGVRLDSLEAIETGYPFTKHSSFDADDPAVAKIWEVSVRTAERCAGETYFDCPYYEQLQYAGDTRIQALIGYYMGRDRALQRNAVETLGWSQMAGGLTYSRYPSRQTQIIPPFSLWWVLMLYDQVLYDTHRSHGIQAISMAASAIEGAQHAIIENEFWHFADWVPDWRWGVPPGRGYSMNWFLAETARISKIQKLSKAMFSVADEIAIQMGEEEEEEERDFLRGFRKGLKRDVEFENGLVKHQADDHWSPSEHTEALYRQYEMILGMEPSPWPYAALERANAAKCTYYFSYYKHLAMQPDDYLAQLGPWKEMIEEGLSTFAENPAPTRSDCHAWSAHPILGFFQIVAGVTSVAPGWKKARIAPRPGSLKRFQAKIAHPDGELRVLYEGEKLKVESPIAFELKWKGKKATMKPGSHEF
jgi:alpha-L-rhamnosidase